MAHEAKTRTRVKYNGKSYGVGETVPFKSAKDAEPYLAAGAIEPGEDTPTLGASDTTLGGANPATGQTRAGPNRADVPVGEVKGKRGERERTEATAGNPSGAATPAGRDATPPAARAAGAPAGTGEQTGTAAGEPKRFDYNGASVDEVEAEFKSRGLTADGSGTGGNLLKKDMVAALEADDQSRGGEDKAEA